MKRHIEEQLIQWKNDMKRKPLLLNGIRQVGKTWILKEFGKLEFEDVLYINFDMEPSLKDIFVKTKDPKKILFEFSLIAGKKINEKTTLIILDEIQECNEALNALKYFNEADESYYVAGAGSYLGIVLSKGSSFPVGQVEILTMYPMVFKEFLVAMDEGLLADYLGQLDSDTLMNEPVIEKLNDYLKKYYVIGGMPEAVQTWVQTEDIEKVSKVQRHILNAYYRDFSKYPPAEKVPKIVGIWDSIVSQLSRENKKFKYSEVSQSARAREYEGAMEWLIAGRYLNKVQAVKKLETPMKAYVYGHRFKIYFPDTGLLREMAGYTIDMTSNNQFMGAIAENFVLQEMIASGEEPLYYWAEKQYEIDFAVSRLQAVIPIEVKAGTNVRSASLSKLMESHELGVRFSMKNLKKDGQILNLPLFMVSELRRFI